MSKKTTNRCCTITTAILLILICILGISFLSIVLRAGESDSEMIRDIQNNLNSKGIAAIEVKNPSEKCSIGYTDLLNLNFPGTEKLCLCSNQNISVILEPKGSGCPYRNLSCRLENIPQMDLPIYRKKKLCMRPTEFNYEVYVPVNDKDNCPQGTRVCGKDQEKYLCLSNTYVCPINYLNFVKNSETQPISSLIKGERIRQIDNEYSLVYSQENYEGKIVSQTSWTFNKKCVDPSEIQIKNPVGLEFLNFSKHFVDECTTILQSNDDSRWEIYNSYNFYKSLAENSSFFNSLQESEITSPSKLSRPINLIKRSYVHFNKACKHNPQASIHENLEDLRIRSNKKENNMRPYLIGALIIFSLMLIASFIYCCMSCGEHSNINSAGICCCIISICFFIIIFFLILICIKIAQMATNNPHLASEECVDQITSNQFKFSFARNVLWLGLINGALGLGILGLLLLCCNKCCCWMKEENYYSDADRAAMNSNSLHFSGGNYQYYSNVNKDDKKKRKKKKKKKKNKNKNHQGYNAYRESDSSSSSSSDDENRSGDEPWNYSSGRDRDSNYNYWDKPGQQINQFNYSDRGY